MAKLLVSIDEGDGHHDKSTARTAHTALTAGGGSGKPAAAQAASLVDPALLAPGYEAWVGRVQGLQQDYEVKMLEVKNR